MPPVRPVDGAVRWFHESFVPGKIVVGWSCADYIFPSAPRIGFLRDERFSHSPHHTGHGPFRTRPSFSIKSYFKKFTNPVITKVLTRLINRLPTSGTIKNASGD